MRYSLLFAAALLIPLSAAAKESGYCNRGKECKIYESYNLSGKVCFSFRDDDNQPIRVHMRRTANGKPKDLDHPIGGRCLNLKGVIYRVYIIAEYGPVKWTVTQESTRPGP